MWEFINGALVNVSYNISIQIIITATLNGNKYFTTYSDKQMDKINTKCDKIELLIEKIQTKLLDQIYF